MQPSEYPTRARERRIGAVERALLLKSFAGYAGLSAPHLAVLASVARERFFRKGTVIHEPGHAVTAFHLIVEGQVQMYRDDRKTMLLGSRSTVGGVAALTGDMQGAHAVATEDTLALEIDTDDMGEIYEDNFEIFQGVLRAVATYLRALQMQRGGSAVRHDDTFPSVEVDAPLGLIDKMFLLRQTRNFREMNIDGLAQIAQDASPCTYEPGEEIWADGAPSGWSTMVLAGGIKCISKHLPPFTLGVGFIAGGLDSFARKDRWYRALATERTFCLILPLPGLLDVLEEHPDMGERVLRSFASAVATLQRDDTPPSQQQSDSESDSESESESESEE